MGSAYAGDSMTKLGRPPQEQRIQELEKQLNTLLNILKGLSDRVAQLESRAVYKPDYEPRFERWPALR
jgi:hypothetical protein